MKIHPGTIITQKSVSGFGEFDKGAGEATYFYVQRGWGQASCLSGIGSVHSPSPPPPLPFHLPQLNRALCNAVLCISRGLKHLDYH